MGMYTELNIGVSLRSDTPLNVINIIEYMLSDDNMKMCDMPFDHPLFSTERWHFMLLCGSYYFDGQPDSHMVRDDIDHEYKCNVRCNLKNYDNEIELFLDFIRPYLVTRGFLGYKRYEEDGEPTLIYNNKHTNMIEYKYAENGLPYKYNPETNTFEEIER